MFLKSWRGSAGWVMATGLLPVLAGYPLVLEGLALRVDLAHQVF